MKTRLLVMIVLISSFFTTVIHMQYADAEFETVYEKERGMGLTAQECEQRLALVGIHFVPDMNLAKLKAENHHASSIFLMCSSIE